MALHLRFHKQKLKIYSYAMHYCEDTLMSARRPQKNPSPPVEKPANRNPRLKALTVPVSAYSQYQSQRIHHTGLSVFTIPVSAYSPYRSQRIHHTSLSVFTISVSAYSPYQSVRCHFETDSPTRGCSAGEDDIKRLAADKSPSHSSTNPTTSPMPTLLLMERFVLTADSRRCLNPESTSCRQYAPARRASKVPTPNGAE